ncbi:alpha,alpha-phosphotrehalase [Aliivibrio sp. S4TY2]|uniref:alpha,alpha-phosphotrehalase n=1 Tax=unclassified Aliivibrio TaxID=2645654 RepID=UPI002378611C|nr:MULTISPECIES: alpha,alpha-phosphotrehalase [unclassified Aliivibrio]MDD9158169.1 alpha,alpha-phosphotrehalase [Aliivibrio sp. S4TY2]MDD9162084.1 alpha,alpha-phosphotrehalase [Aliivibrio sp. S4TY1]MDD9165972.1 alpha,alpha-phosphotrehalase [Aliivibrio sp. S4MY2]MDD9169958.1 alpha,alpha-phosphotrehalase [Aliivibrio sp. S4MY4]MDD9187021.1 alpha,alpha-phosphotrehalase [Aliivibrio sp. S4MY3]
MTNSEWWRTATIYQIYPKSFCDSSNKGTGDIQGIISKLDYLQKLGVDAIWLTPVYQSPMIDNGYDIADYYSINSNFGTMIDFDNLLEEAKSRGIRIIMDIVVNHTSTEHHWFQSALGNKESEYRDYYIWKDPVDEKVPTNWQSKFGGNAWALDEATNQYYLHLFAKEQADLNWENPKVRQEVKEIISFWAEKGVDGFRLDVINLISKPNKFTNDENGDGRRFYTDGPKVHQYLQEISEAVFQKYGSVTVGEMSSTTLDHCQKYSAQDGKELSMVFNFHHLKADYKNGEKWTKAPFDFLSLKSIFNHWQTGLNGKGWGALFWCNHDQPRVVSRLGNDKEYRELSAKMLASSVHMMQGTPYIYQGEEIGMTNPHYTSIDQYRDLESTNMFDIMVNQEKSVSEAEMLEILDQKSRDNSRTPMQWNSARNAGFTQGKPWLSVANNYLKVNAELALTNPDSVFYFYKKLIQLRKDIDVITTGDYVDLMPKHEELFCYQRENETHRLIAIHNFYKNEVGLSIDVQGQEAECILSNYGDMEAEKPQSSMVLRPYECRVILIEK